MAYSGLETLFQNMGPTYAASMAGEREGMAQGQDIIDARKKQEELLALQQAYKQADVMNPLKAQFEQGRINEQGAMLPGQQAESRLKGTAADVAGATAKSTIGKTNSANDLAQMGDQVQKLSKMRDMATQLVSNIMSAGPGADAAKNQLIASGTLPPQIAQMFVNVPAAKLPDLLAKANAYVNQQSAAYQQAVATANIQKESHLGGAQIAADAMLKGKQMDIDAGKFKDKKAGLQDIEAQVQSGKMTAERAAVALHGAAMFESDPETKKLYEQMASQYETFAMNQKNAQAGGKPDLNKLGVETQKMPPALAPATKPSLPPGWVMK